MKEKARLNVKAVAARLKELRTGILKVSLLKINEVTGVPASGISMMERGAMKPSAAYLHGLAHVFDVNINWILTGKGTTFKPDVEMKLNFGDDNETVKNMFTTIAEIPLVRFEMLKHFLIFMDQGDFPRQTDNKPPQDVKGKK